MRSHRNSDEPRSYLSSEKREIFVSAQVLLELYVALTKGRHPIATPDIAQKAVREASLYSIVHVDTSLVLSAIGAARTHRVSFWNALILRAAASAECDVLLSEDLNEGQTIDGVRIENPFS